MEWSEVIGNLSTGVGKLGNLLSNLLSILLSKLLSSEDIVELDAIEAVASLCAFSALIIVCGLTPLFTASNFAWKSRNMASVDPS